MTFTLNEEQRLLKDAARDFCREQAPVTRFRKMRDEKKNGRDPELWREMAQMGWAGIVVPEEHGGAGLGYVGLGLVLEETGRTLAASPLLSTAMIGASALVLGGSDKQKTEWLPKIAAGEVVTALAVDEGRPHLRTRLCGSYSSCTSGSSDGQSTDGSPLSGGTSSTCRSGGHTSGRAPTSWSARRSCSKERSRGTCRR